MLEPVERFELEPEGRPPYLASKNCFCRFAHNPSSASSRCTGARRTIGICSERLEEEDASRCWSGDDGAASA